MRWMKWNRLNRNWLTELYEMVSTGSTDKSIDMIFDKIDNLHTAGDFDSVDNILYELDATRLTTTVLIAFLSITKAARDELYNREDLIRRIEQELKIRCPDRVEVLLKGLR